MIPPAGRLPLIEPAPSTSTREEDALRLELSHARERSAELEAELIQIRREQLPPSTVPLKLQGAEAATGLQSLPAPSTSIHIGVAAAPLQLELHVKARSGDNPAYPPRHRVQDALVRWDALFDGYMPPEWTHPAVLSNSRDLATGDRWADPPDVLALRAELEQRTTLAHGGRPSNILTFDAKSGAPLNPVGRTGLCGRGLLGKWGPNPAADPVITRHHPTSGALQVVSMQRKDTLQWALPGGFVDAGETVSETVRREFMEEAGNIEGAEGKALFRRLVEQLFKGAMAGIASGTPDDIL